MSAEWIPPIRPLRALHATQAIHRATRVRRGAMHGAVVQGADGQADPHLPPELTLTPFERHYRRAFPQLDGRAGAKGYLTPQDLDDLLWASGDDTVLVRTLRDYELACRDEDRSYLYQAASIVERTVEHGWLGGRSDHDVETGLSPHLGPLLHYYAEELSYAAFFEEYVDVFSDWNRQAGGKGYLDGDDIWRLVADPALRADNAAALATLCEALRGGVAKGDTLEFHPQDAIHIDAQGVNRSPHYLFHQRFLLAGLWNQKQRVLTGTSRQVFASPTPDWQAVRQTGFSDCYFEAMLAGLARRDSEAVFRMIVPSGEGTVTVVFGDGSRSLVTLPTDAELALHANSGMDGRWATVLHKAWLANPGANLDTLTGRPSRRLRMPVDVDLVRAMLRASHGVVVVGLGRDTQFQHYTVMAFDAENDVVSIRDEWGLVPASGNRDSDYALTRLMETLVCLEAEINAA